MSILRGQPHRARMAVCALCGLAMAAPAPAAERRVIIDGMAFTPPVVEARPGDVVTWVNKDMFVHTVAIASGPRSGELQPGQTWRYAVPAGAASAIGYSCTLHPTMTGRIQVLAGAGAVAKRQRH